MNDQDRQFEVLATCLDEYHSAARSGEPVDPGLYAERLGPLYVEFRGLVDTESALDRVLEPQEPTELPRNFGEYTLLQELGRGAMGVVFRARHRTLERDVAMKVLRAGFDTDDTARQRFKREAKALARVAHDHIVKVHDFGEVDGIPFYTMTLVSGPSLSQLRKDGALPDPKTLCAGMVGIADALEALHQAGVVHRDLKPSNIMMDPETGRYLLADFGLARTSTAVTMTRTGDSLGTPLYMSPEQILGKRDEVDARTDIYGLGATLYEMLTGRPPFKTDDMQALMRMVLQQRPVAPHTLDPSIPRECENIALKCLEKRAADRYQCAADMASDLRAFLAGDKVQGRPVSMLRHRARIVRNRPLLVAATLLAIALPGVLFYLLNSQGTRLFVETEPQLEGVLSLNGKTYESASIADGVEVERDTAYRIEFTPADERYVVGAKTVTPREAGVERLYLLALPRDPNDLARYNALGAKAKVEMGVIEQRANTRAGPSEGPLVLLVLPRGKVRPQDLRENRVQLQVQVSEFFQHEGQLTFRVDGEEVAREPWGAAEATNLINDVKLPEAARQALKAGVQARWSFEAKGLQAHADFQVVADDLADGVLARIDEALVGAPHNAVDLAVIAATLKARALSQLELHQAAYDLIREHLANGGKETLLLRELQYAALKSLFGKQVEFVNAAKDLLIRIGSHGTFTPAEQDAVYGSAQR